MSKLLSSAVFAALVALWASDSAQAEILITQAKVIAGNVTPSDTPGFPVTLSLPGKYRLASNIYPTANQTGIRIAQRNVTIDLNGFELHGGSIANHGITGAQVGTTAKNGIITGFKFDGISISGNRATVENMQIAENGRQGAELYPGRSHLVFNSRVTDNGGDGIRCAFCVVTSNVIDSNGSDGIEGAGGSFVGNFIANNTGYGLFTGSIGSGYAHNTPF